MKISSLNKPNKNYLDSFLKYAIFGSLIATIGMVTIPADPKNIFLFGYSKIRLAILLLFVFLISTFLVLLIKSYRDNVWRENLEERLIKSISGAKVSLYWFSVLIISIIIAPYVYLFYDLQRYSYILLRSVPIFFLCYWLLLNFGIVILNIYFSNNSQNSHIIKVHNCFFVTPQQLFTGLLLVIFTLLLAHIFTRLLRNYFWESHNFNIVVFYNRTFNFDKEWNAPTIFSSLQLLLGFWLAIKVAVFKRKQSRPDFVSWIFLGILFFVLSLDELFLLHEKLQVPMDQIFRPEGVLHYFSWVLGGIPLTIIVGLSFLRFVLQLPKQLKNQIFLSAFLFLTGAIGFELFGGWQNVENIHLINGFVVIMIEELLEMIGITVFLYAILGYLNTLRIPKVNNGQV